MGDGYLWYSMGRTAAEGAMRDREHARVMRGIFEEKKERERYQANIQALSNENARLRAEIAQLSHALKNYKHNYNNLKQWADSVEPDLEKYWAQSEGK